MFLKTAGHTEKSCKKLINTCFHMTITKLINLLLMIHLKTDKKNTRGMIAKWIIAQIHNC